MTITDIEVALYSSNPEDQKCALHWNQGGDRFHIWFDNERAIGLRKLTKNDTLYKNPGASGASYARCKFLNPLAKCNASAIYEARRIAVADHLYSKARAKQVAENEENHRIVEEEKRDRRIKNHGLELLAALRGLLKVSSPYRQVEGSDEERLTAHRAAHEAIANATEEG